MIHKWLEEWYDTLLYLVSLIGLLVFFLGYWRGEYQVRFAELVLQEFLVKASAEGKITREEYEKMIRNLDEINPEYEVGINCVEYILQPLYALIPEEKISEYYVSRNVRMEVPLSYCDIVVEEEDADLLCFQEETNSTILAAGHQEYLPLPDEETLWNIAALRPYQEVYEGESLITICCIKSKDGNFYVEAEPMAATSSGTVWLQLDMGEPYDIPVEVLCHPRNIICENGHEVVNTKDIINGITGCPYCEILPEEISCNTAVLHKETGTEFSEDEIWITVKYLDGHMEKVSPESEEWQDSYDKNYCGIQQVTIRYREKEDTVMVVTENKGCQACGKACNERCHEDYVSFPYCTECMSKVSLFTGEVYDEEQWVSTGEVVACLDETGERTLQAGDCITLYLSDGKNYVTLLQKEIKQDGKGGE